MRYWHDWINIILILIVILFLRTPPRLGKHLFSIEIPLLRILLTCRSYGAWIHRHFISIKISLLRSLDAPASLFYWDSAPTELGYTGISFLFIFRSYGACIHPYLISIKMPLLRSWKTVKLNQAFTINNSSLVSSSLVSSSPITLCHICTLYVSCSERINISTL